MEHPEHERLEKCEHGYYRYARAGAGCPHGCSDELVERENHRGPGSHAAFDQKHAAALEQLRGAGAFLLATTTPNDPLGVDVTIALGGRMPEGTHRAVAQAFLLALHDRIETMIEELAPPQDEEERGWVRRWLGH